MPWTVIELNAEVEPDALVVAESAKKSITYE